ncbi:hypothetical protein LXA43DRAFT_1102893 [Ganoderma leucocontextum]|nr:hypothetical protein LXA43DRAFT_1102893 [Ganoderma leucocontextum]
MKAQMLPAFGLSPSLDNLEIRLGRCEHATLDKDLERLSENEAVWPATSTGKGPVLTVFNELHAPLLLAAPEAISGWPGPFSAPVNIWAAGHLLFQCLTGEIVYTKRVNRMGLEFPDYGEVHKLCDPHALEERLRSFAHINEGMGDRDVQATCALLARCFDPNPTERPTAKRLLADKWFRVRS